MTTAMNLMNRGIYWLAERGSAVNRGKGKVFPLLALCGPEGG